MKLSHFNENYILTYLLGPAFEAKTLQSWCKNDVNSRISQTNMIDFTLLTLVDAFTLHMLLDLHIVIILHSVLYILILYIYIYIYISLCTIRTQYVKCFMYIALYILCIL
jgi:hypothetical protein